MTIPQFLSYEGERAELAATVRKLFERRHDESEVRRWMEVPDAFDRGLWRELAGGIGVTALPVGEEDGGAGYGWAELLPVFEESGRALYGGPLLSTAIAVAVIQAAGDDRARRRLLPGIAAGATTATVTPHGPAPAATAALPVRAVRTSDGWRLTGVAPGVLDGATADLVVVAAATDDGPMLLTVSAEDAPGLTRTPLTTLDQTRKQADLGFDSTPATPLGGTADTAGALAAGAGLAALLVAAESLGTARRCLADAVAYARTRYQFSRPIGSFQAVKHRCADMWVAVESAGVVLAEADDGLSATGTPDARDTEHALIACLRALDVCAEGTMRVHGGISFTWEHPAHLSYRRARNAQSLLGPVDGHTARLAALAGVPGGDPALI
ncbi:acyl-CoA dehydrogenase family protein [Streptomyces sp. NPDC004726]